MADFNETSPEPYQLSMSVGMAHHDDDPRIRLEDLVERADAAMYEEKNRKRTASLRNR